MGRRKLSAKRRSLSRAAKRYQSAPRREKDRERGKVILLFLGVALVWVALMILFLRG